MRNLRCWTFGHEWIATFVERNGDVERTRMATCPRCGMTTAFVDGDRDGNEVTDA